MRDWLEHVGPLESVLVKQGFSRDDPRSSLAQNTLKLEHSRPYRLFLATPIMGIWFGLLLMGLLGWPWQAVVLVVVVATIVTPLCYLRPSWRIEIALDGVRCRRGAAVVKLPWEIFDPTGTPWVDSWDRRMVLAIKPDAVARLELWCDGMRLAQGPSIMTRQVKVLGTTKVAIKGAYGIDPLELAAFLMWLASTLAPTVLDASAQIAEGDSRPSAFSELSQGSLRWLTLDLSRPELPGACCGCGQPEFKWRQTEVLKLWLLALTAGQYRSSIHLAVPVCNRCCHRHMRWRWALASIAGGLGAVVALLSGLNGGATTVSDILLIITGGAVVFGLIGFAVGECTHRPFKFTSYSKRKLTVRARFRSDSYTQRVRESQRTGAISESRT